MDVEREIEVGGPRYGGLFEVGEHALPFVLPGEIVDSGKVVRASPERVAPGCVHFGVCGGCQYQHAAYAAQLELKREVLDGLLGSLDGLPATRVHAGEPWGYRNRIRLRVQREEGSVRVGYSLRGSNDFLPVTMCPIAAPLLWRGAQALLVTAAEDSLDSLSARWLDAVSEVELFCLADETRLQAQFFLREAGPGDAVSFARFCERLRVHLPELAGAGAEIDPELSRRTRRTWTGTAWGTAGQSYPVDGRNYWVGRGAFFQVNRFLVGRLVELVCAGEGGELAWDLFAGVGLFSRALAEKFERVVAVEGGEQAAAALAIAAKAARTMEAVRAPALEFLRTRELQRERPELVVLDPPRAGIGVEGAAILARLRPARIVYVSCDPVTLARDLAVLVRGGYGVDAVEMIDLFPQTYHLETVVRLRRLG